MTGVNEPVLDLLKTEFGAVEELCELLEPEDWDRQSECPGWTVKDNLSHLCGIEAMLLGLETPPPLDPSPEHVRNPFGALNEAQIIERRPRAPEEIVQEFRKLTAERVKVLEGLSRKDWEAETVTPIGPGVQRDLIALRVLDIYYHEQDMRRGAGIPGHHIGPVPEFVAGRMRRSVPRSLVKGAGVRPGSIVAFDVTTGPAEPFAVEVREDGRGYEVERPPDPRVAFTFTTEAFLRLCGGRWNIGDAVADGRVAVDGDGDLGRRILENLAATP